jgi:hypothetical protein
MFNVSKSKAIVVSLVLFALATVFALLNSATPGPLTLIYFLVCAGPLYICAGVFAIIAIRKYARDRQIIEQSRQEKLIADKEPPPPPPIKTSPDSNHLILPPPLKQ